jgi:PAB1-binding protein PBP1
MANTLDKIEIVTEYKHLQIREIKDDGGYHRRVLKSDMDVSGEVQEIQDKAEAEWTDEIKTAWTTFKAEQEAQRSNP